jgi:hypothetical protein
MGSNYSIVRSNFQSAGRPLENRQIPARFFAKIPAQPKLSTVIHYNLSAMSGEFTGRCHAVKSQRIGSPEDPMLAENDPDCRGLEGDREQRFASSCSAISCRAARRAQISGRAPAQVRVRKTG